MQTEFDVVIIGSGAGGSPIAYTLVKAGKSVLILEKGPLFRPQYQNPQGLSDFKRDELFADSPEKRIRVPGVANQNEAFYSSHVEPDINDEPHIYRDPNGQDRATIEGYTAQVVGGGTQLYGGVSLRFTPTDLRLQSFNAGRKDLKNDPNGDVRYRNAMMDGDNPDRADDNIIDMRWIVQRELGGSNIFFHEVTIPPGKVEGTHQHIGTEELYYITEGEGIAYMRVGDDPATDKYPTVERQVMGLGNHEFKELPVKSGSIIFTKSGGMHGIRNPGTKPLKFVAFLYHTI
ncbi:FAD-binding protein [Nostoc sp.]|uniref:FAD-binding protein n=1 Tax=Nostoc sp. TaxID=1180 RepID=UPI002FF3D598